MTIELTDDAIKALTVLRRKLDEFYYGQIHYYSRYGQYLFGPWLTLPEFAQFERIIVGLPSAHRLLSELFYLGKTLRIKDSEEIFSIEELQNLVKIGLLRSDGESVSTDGLSVASLFGCYFIASTPTNYPTRKEEDGLRYVDRGPYINADSYVLAQNLSIPRGSEVLDLCTGSGIQAILASGHAKKVVGVEIDSVAAKIATYNVVLNNLEDKIEIREGNLYGPVMGEHFDVICSNPPFMAVPDGVNYGRWGSGGPDGLRVISRILDDLDAHLAIGGKFFYDRIMHR